MTQREDLARRALGEAWRAWQAGSFPVGAVLADDGAIVSTGRNAIYGDPSPTGGILSHAEIVALRHLSPTQQYDHLTLVTTLEPCLMCMGAVMNARVGTVRFLGADPYGGAAHLDRINPQMQRYDLVIEGPAPGRIGIVAAGLAVAYLLATGTWPRVLEVFAGAMPAVVASARQAVAGGLPDLAASGASFEEAERLFG